jgi:hypothetical protein
MANAKEIVLEVCSFVESLGHADASQLAAGTHIPVVLASERFYIHIYWIFKQYF